MKIEICKYLAQAMHSARMRLRSSTIGDSFMKADYLECGNFDKEKFLEAVKLLFDEWGLEVLFQREMVSRPNLVAGPVRMFICDRNGVEEQVAELDEIMLINFATMSTFYASIDEQPPESDCLLSITICPQNERIVEHVKTVFPNATHTVRNSGMGANDC